MRAVRGKAQSVPKGAKAARKSAAVIILEKDVTHLRGDVSAIKKVLWGVASGVGAILVTVLGSLATFLLSPR